MKNYEYKFVEVPTSENGKEANAPLKICAQITRADHHRRVQRRMEIKTDHGATGKCSQRKQLSDYSGKRSRLNNIVPVNYKLPL